MLRIYLFIIVSIVSYTFLKAQIDTAQTYSFQIPPSGVYDNFVDLRLGNNYKEITYRVKIDTTFKNLKQNKQVEYLQLRDVDLPSRSFIQKNRIEKPFIMFYAVSYKGELYINTQTGAINSIKDNRSFGSWKDNKYVKVLHIGRYIYFEIGEGMDVDKGIVNVLASDYKFKTGYILNLNSSSGQVFEVNKKLLDKLLQKDKDLHKEYTLDADKNSLEKRRYYITKFSEKYQDKVLPSEAYLKKVEEGKKSNK